MKKTKINIVIEIEGGCLVGLWSSRGFKIHAELVDWDSLKESLSAKQFDKKENEMDMKRSKMQEVIL